MTSLDNANPLVFSKSTAREVLPEEEDDNVTDEIDSREVFGKKIMHALIVVLICVQTVVCSLYSSACEKKTQETMVTIISPPGP